MGFNKTSSEPPDQIEKELSVHFALSHTTTIKEPHLIGNWVLWLEQRPHESGRTTALIRPWGELKQKGQELTPSPKNLKTRVHEYGGGVLAAAEKNNELIMTWIDDQDGCLWAQWWKGMDQEKGSSPSVLKQKHPPKRLSQSGIAPLADGIIDLSRERWIGLMEQGGKDFLVTFSLREENQSPKILHCAEDFAGYACLSPDQSQLAWVEWQKPCMPWDASQLWLGCFDNCGEIKEKALIAGDINNQNTDISVFQPTWSPEGQLVVAEDSSGWWNPMISSKPITNWETPCWTRPWGMHAETAMPQWVYGMRTFAWSGNNLLALSCEQGLWHLKELSCDGSINEIAQPFDDLAYLQAQPGRALAIASNPTTGTGILEIELDSGAWRHSPANIEVIKTNQISIPEPFFFKGYQGKETQAWYYPPIEKGGDLVAPLLVKSHSGPTSMARHGLNLAIQFWTSRGWGVVDVNYGGSTGFGRAYRERLKYGWGEVDVQDCASAAQALIDLGKAKKEHIAIEGSSASGFTTLACLCFQDLFKVGACRYAVSDLASMAKDTHRFEAHYLDSLIGPLPKNKKLYESRSPILHADKITCPVIFFQGLKDKVVPPAQTEKMANTLKNNNIPVEVYTFPDEGHGFRDSKVQIKVLEATEVFFKKHLLL